MLAISRDTRGAFASPKPASVAIRPLREADLSKLAWWYNRTVPVEARQRRYRSAAEMNKHLIKLAGRDSRHFGILSNGRLVGYAGWNDHMEVFIFIGWPDKRRKGIGTRAMRMLMYEFKKAGKLIMSAKTAAPDFWLKLGFRERERDWRQKDHRSGTVSPLVFLTWRAHGPS